MRLLSFPLLSGTKDLLSIPFQSPFSCDWSHWTNGVLTYWISDSSQYHSLWKNFVRNLMTSFMSEEPFQRGEFASLPWSFPCNPVTPLGSPSPLSFFLLALRWTCCNLQVDAGKGCFFHSLKRFGIKNKITSQIRIKGWNVVNFCDSNNWRGENKTIERTELP